MTFAPDHSGISLYATDFASYAVEQGHEVTVVTAFSWYPKWTKRPEDEGKFFRTDRYGKIKVLRGYLYVPQKVTTINRVLQEITFLVFAFCNFIRAGRHDTIVLFTTPINLGLIGVFFQKIWGAKLINNVQDLQLDAAETLGMLNKSPVVRIMDFVERFNYKHADLVTSISEAMVNLVRQKGVPDNQLYQWPNWINVDEAGSRGEEGAFRQKFPQYRNKLLIGYAGNVGVKQSLSVLIDLAKKFDTNSDIVYLIIGQGGDLEALKAYAREQAVTNVDFIDFLSQDDYYNFLSDVDVVFLSQKKDSGDAYFPSKLLGIMAKKKLIFVAAGDESEIYKVVAENDLGMLADISDIDKMQQILTHYLVDKDHFAKYETNVISFVRKFDREVVLSELFDRVHQIRNVSTDVVIQ